MKKIRNTLKEKENSVKAIQRTEGNTYCQSPTISMVFSSALLSFPFFNHSIDSAFLESWLEAAVAGDAGRGREVTFFPAVDQPGLPDEGARGCLPALFAVVWPPA